MAKEKLVLGGIISRLPVLKSEESIRAAALKFSDKIGFEDAAAAITLKEREKGKGVAAPKDVRLDALLDIGFTFNDPLVEEMNKLESQRNATILELERKYGKDLNGEIQILSEFADVDTALLEDLQKSVIGKE
jgi:hypothetical protein